MFEQLTLLKLVLGTMQSDEIAEEGGQENKKESE